MDGIITKERLLYFKSYIDEYKWLRYQISRNPIREQELRTLIIEEQSYIKSRILKIRKYNYRKILTMRYIFHFQWRQIIKNLFSQESDFEFQLEDKYKDKTLCWHRQALKELEKVSRLPEETTALKLLKKIKRVCENELIQNLTPSKDDFIKKLLTIIKIEQKNF